MMLSVSVVIPTFLPIRRMCRREIVGRGGVSNASLFISTRAISLPLDAANALVSLNGLDANQKDRANG